MATELIQNHNPSPTLCTPASYSGISETHSYRSSIASISHPLRLDSSPISSFLRLSPTIDFFSPVASPSFGSRTRSRNAFPRLLLGEDDLFFSLRADDGFGTMGHLPSPMTPLSPSTPSMIAKEQFIHSNLSLLPMTPPDPTDADVLKASGSHWATSVGSAVHVISTERAALANLEHLYQTNFLAQEHLARAVSQIASSIRNGGKLVCCGVGKSGKIAQKLEATMNSLGIYSAFLHPTEALHGDLGMIRPVCGFLVPTSLKSSLLTSCVTARYPSVDIILGSHSRAASAAASYPFHCAGDCHHEPPSPGNVSIVILPAFRHGYSPTGSGPRR